MAGRSPVRGSDDGTRHRGPMIAVAALGVVFGDIGTSPLYAMREALGGSVGVSPPAVLGIVSLVFWAMTVVISVKYVAFVMRADNHGEGGILALTALVPDGSARRRGLVVMGVFGAALLYGDGAITPAISVLSAVEGLRIVTDGVEGLVVPIAVAVIVGLFAIQRHGTRAVGAVFGPVMVVWFATLALLGIVQVVAAPAVLAAIDPRHAIDLFADQPRAAFRALGSVFLVVTGGEALYADMGHFGPRPIRRMWFAVVMPALLLNYAGQGALLLADPTTIDHPFYRLAPGWALLPLVVLATAATVIASQALISGAFSLTLQAVQLGYAPRLDIDHTSARERGQVYVASVNRALLVVCIGLVLGFRTSSGLAAAYGLAVTGTMAITSVLFWQVARHRWGWSRLLAGAPVALFLLADLAFLGSNLLKVRAGGWFPLLVGVTITALMTTWKTGRRLLYQGQRRGRTPVDALVRGLSGRPRTPGTAVYLHPEPSEVPPAFLANLRANDVVHEDVVFLTVAVADRPHVPPAARDTITRLAEGFHRVVLTYGFMDEPDVPGALGALMGDVSFERDTTHYFLGRESVIPSDRPGMARWREWLFMVLHRNATSAARYYRLPPARVVEIGVPVEI